MIRLNFPDQKLLTKSVLSALIRGIGALTSLLMSWIIARYYGAEVAGLFFLALAIITFLGTVTRAGVDLSIVRFVGAAEGSNQGARIVSVIEKSLKLTIPLTLLASATLALGGHALANYIFSKAALGPVLVAMGLALPGITLLTIYGMGLQGLHKTVSSVLTLKIAGPLFFIAFVLAAPNKEEINLSGLYAGAMLLAGSIGAALFYAQRPANNEGRGIPWRQFTDSSRPLWLGQMAQQIMLLSSQILCGIWLTSQDVALLTAAQRAAMLTPFILLAVNMIVTPKFAGLYETQAFEELEKLATDASKLMILVGAPVAIFIFILSSYIMSAFGPEFTEAAILLQIITAGQLVNVATGSANVLLVGSGNEDALKSTYYLGAAIVLIACALLIPTYGVVGGAIATGLAIAVQNIATVIMVRRTLGISVLPGLKMVM